MNDLFRNTKILEKEATHFKVRELRKNYQPQPYWDALENIFRKEGNAASKLAEMKNLIEISSKNLSTEEIEGMKFVARLYSQGALDRGGSRFKSFSPAELEVIGEALKAFTTGTAKIAKSVKIFSCSKCGREHSRKARVDCACGNTLIDNPEE